MRRFIPYILIFIILIGIFSPVTKVGADELGVCLNSVSKEMSFQTSTVCDAGVLNNKHWCGGIPPTIPVSPGIGTCFIEFPCAISFLTQSACKDAPGGWWSSQLPPTSNDPKGTCYSDGKTYTNWTKNACSANSDNAFWDANDAPRGTCVIDGKTNQNWQENGCKAYKGVWSINGDQNGDQIGTCTTTDSRTSPPTVTSSSGVKRADCPTNQQVPDVSVSFVPSTTVSGDSSGESPTPPPPKTTYDLIQPLPNPSGGGLFSVFNPKGDNKISEYLNLMIKIFIGICAVLAVIMIVKAGIEYMASELISSKEEAKKDIQGAVFGLLLALGAWLLLNTINPDILKTDLSNFKNVEVDVTIDESPATAVMAGSTETSAGMINASGIIVNSNIANGVNTLMAKAKTDGIPLAGGGFRSTASQTQLRIRYCHGDTTSSSPTPPCNPPTALPGHSMHESGQAIDFTCSGVLIQNTTNQCFVWLSANSGIAGLTNFSKEPWHWSTNGK